MLPRRIGHRGYTIVVDATGISIEGFGSGYTSVDAARSAIDQHLDKPKEIPVETTEQPAAESSTEDNGMPLPEPQQVRRSRVRR